MRVWVLAATSAAVLAAAGCASTPRPGQARLQRLEVQVENHNRADVNVYVDRNGSRIRLGTVVSGGGGTYVMRNYAPLPLQRVVFQVERIGVDRNSAGGVFSLPPVTVALGQSVRVRIEDLLTSSEVIVQGDEPAVSPKQMP
jgi:hypothetical protein